MKMKIRMRVEGMGRGTAVDGGNFFFVLFPLKPFEVHDAVVLATKKKVSFG